MNLTECKDCGNGFVIAGLRERLRSVAEKISMNAFERTKIVENKAELNYQEISYDRRGFFRTLKHLTVQGAMGFFNDTRREKNTLSYADKAVPLRRELLNSSFSALPEGMRKRVLQHYYYEVKVDETCNDCFACVGMCPTGALKSDQEEPDTMLFFNSSLCGGCGVCESFCRSSSIGLTRGFSGPHPFRFSSAKEPFSVKETSKPAKECMLERSCY
jgi:ferredoxin